MVKKIPLRKCVVTQERLPKKDLLRIVKNNEGEVFVDLSSKANGRGAYIKKDVAVLELAMKNKNLERALECSIPETVYERIRKVIIDG
ncbi:MAG: YlxR family protein [Bacilli bacterium]|jgi:predicted RNA-binding protein YlxR (DUF448 family)|nr:YlxR family protein [Bacilli bacterium]